MARANITKKTIKGLIKAYHEAGNYSRKKQDALWCLRFIGMACGLDYFDADGMIHGTKWVMETVLTKKLRNEWIGIQIPSILFSDGKPFADMPELCDSSWTHGLNTIYIPDFNKLANVVMEMENWGGN